MSESRAKVRHPAPFSQKVLAAVQNDMIARGLPHSTRVLDPFAGIGRIHVLPFRTTGIELEGEWAEQASDWGEGEVIVGDSLAWMETTRRRFGAVVTSPTYSNRMADHHEAKDKCKVCLGDGKVERAGGMVVCASCRGSGLSRRRSYRHDLGRMPSEGSSATMHWGGAYRDFHRRAWAGVWRALEPGGLFYLNVSDHIRGGRRVRVADWHRKTVEHLGFARLRTIRVATPRLRDGANRDARAGSELVYVFRRPGD